jgi:hypothetical protein
MARANYPAAPATVVTVPLESLQYLSGGVLTPVSEDVVSTPLPVKILSASVVADNDPDTENPLKVGGRYNLAPPVYVDGDKADLQTDINGNLLVNVASLPSVVIPTVVQSIDTFPLLDTWGTPIPMFGTAAIPIVATLFANVTKIQVIEDIGSYMALYADAARTLFLCTLPLGGGEVEISMAAGSSVFIGGLGSSDIGEGKIAINFIG